MANITINISRDGTVVVQDPPKRREYPSLAEARATDDCVNEAYRYLMGGASALRRNIFHVEEVRQLNGFCRAISGLFESEGRPVRLTLFATPKHTAQESGARESTLAVQVSYVNGANRFIDARMEPREGLFDPFLNSAITYVG